MSDFDDFYVDSYRFYSSDSDGILSFSINQIFLFLMIFFFLVFISFLDFLLAILTPQSSSYPTFPNS